MSFLIDLSVNIGLLTDVVSKIIALCAMIAAAWPKPESEAGQNIHKIVNFLAFNFHHAQNR